MARGAASITSANLEGYASEEDEDYVCSGAEDDDEKAMRRRMERKRLGGALRKRKFLTKDKSRKKKRIGAAVISDDEEDMMFDAGPPELEEEAEAVDESASLPREANSATKHMVSNIWDEMAVSSSSKAKKGGKKASSKKGSGKKGSKKGKKGKKKVVNQWEAWLKEPSKKKKKKKEKDKETTMTTKDEDRKEAAATTGAEGLNATGGDSDGTITQGRIVGEQTIVVKSTHEYAGQKVDVVRKIQKGSVEHAVYEQERAKEAKLSHLDKVLLGLKKQGAMSTLTKSRADWDKDKEQEGDAHELEKFTKSHKSLVAQQNFLKDTELRQWEIKKGARDERRNAMEMAAKRAAQKGKR